MSVFSRLVFSHKEKEAIEMSESASSSGSEVKEEERETLGMLRDMEKEKKKMEEKQKKLEQHVVRYTANVLDIMECICIILIGKA